MTEYNLRDKWLLALTAAQDGTVRNAVPYLMVILERYYAASGKSRCNQVYIAKCVGVSRQAAIGALKRLVDADYIRLVSGGNGVECTYKPNFEHPAFLARLNKDTCQADHTWVSSEHDTTCQVDLTPPVKSALHNSTYSSASSSGYKPERGKRDGSNEPKGREGAAPPPKGGARPTLEKKEKENAFAAVYDMFPHPPSCTEGNREMAGNTYIACLRRGVAPEQILEAMDTNPPNDGEYMAQWINRVFPKASATGADAPQGKRTRTSKPKKPKDAPVKAEAAPVAAEQSQAPVAAPSAANAPKPVTPAPKFEVGQTVKVNGMSDAFTSTVQSVKPGKGGKLVYHVKYARGDGIGSSADFSEHELAAA